MFWSRPKPTWPLDPRRVAFGSVVEAGGVLSHSHVRVSYRNEPGAQCVPLIVFMRRCEEALLNGRPLDIEHLLIAPISKRRYASFFDSLTDWAPAERRARAPRHRAQKPAAP